MVDQVDTIATELTLRYQQYVSGVDAVVQTNKRLRSSIGDLEKMGVEVPARYANDLGKAASAGADAHEKAAARIKTARKATVDTVKQSGAEEVSAEQQTQARLTKAVEDGISARSNAMRRGSGTVLGSTVPGRADNGRQGLLTGVSTASVAQAEVEAEREINHLSLDTFDNQQRLKVLTGERLADLQREMELQRRIEVYKAGGLTETEAQVRAETRLVEMETLRAQKEAELLIARQAGGRVRGQRGGFGSANEFALQASSGRFGYSFSPGALAGTAVAVGAGITIEAVKTATDYADAIAKVSHEAGISAEALQVYQHAAEQTGASAKDVDSALDHLTDQLGKARTGSKDAQKAFEALGVPLQKGDTAGSLLPTLIDRLSSVKDEAQRAAIETALFGQAGENLDRLLSGGNDKVNELAAGLIATGKVLSSSDIAKLEDTSKKLADVKAQLTVDMAQIVANNAEAIKGLANAFVQLADDIKGALHWLDQFDQASPFLAKLDQNPVAAGASLSPGGKGLAPWFYDTIKQSGKYLGFADDSTTPASNKLTPGGLDSLADSAHNYLAKVRPGKINQSAIDTFNQGNGRKGRDPNIALNEADERTKRFNDLMARYQDEQLAAVAQQTADEETRRDQQRAQIQRDAAKDIADLRTQAGIDSRKKGADEALIQARLDQAIAARQAVAFEKTNVVNLEGNASAIDKDVAAQNAILEFKNQQLQAQEDLAKTAGERRDLELKILANEQQIAANSANGVLRKAAQGVPTSDADIAAANRTLANLPASTASKTAVIDKQTQGPLAAYLDSLPRTANQVNEAFQQAEVQGLQGFNSELGKTISGFLKLHGAAGQFIDDLVEIGIKWAEAQLFGGGVGAVSGTAGVIGGLSGASGIGGLLGKIFGVTGNSGYGGNSASVLDSLIGPASPTSISSFSIDPSLLSLPGLAGGGTINVGGRGGIDRNTLSLNGQPVARVNMGEQIHVVNPNQRVNGPQSGGPTFYQTIQYSGAVDIADKPYVNQMGAALASSTRALIGQSSAQVLQAAPGAVRKSQTYKD